MTCSDLWHRRSPQCRIVPDGSEQASSQEAVPVCAKGEACTMHVVPDKIAAATAEGGLLYRHTAVDTAGERWMLHCTIEALVV